MATNDQDLVLRAYDDATVQHAESLPVRRLWTLLESGGLWDVAKVRPGLTEKADLYARETIVARLEALVQEGYGDASLFHLRGGDPPDLATLRLRHWPAIGPEEAVQLREDLVRYLTYGLWHAPEAAVGRTLELLTGSSDPASLADGSTLRDDIRELLDVVVDDAAFAQRFSSVVRAALQRSGSTADDAAVAGELNRAGRLLGPAARLLRAARTAGLRVIAYRDRPSGDGLTRFLSALTIIATILLTGCGSGDSAKGSGTTAATATGTLQATVAPSGDCVPATTDGSGGPYPASVSADCTHRALVEVDVVDDPNTTGGFSPSNITVSAGTTVKFVWKSSNHNLHPFHDDIEDTGYIFYKTFGKPGKYQYNCQVHPGQNGVVYVR